MAAEGKKENSGSGREKKRTVRIFFLFFVSLSLSLSLPISLSSHLTLSLPLLSLLILLHHCGSPRPCRRTVACASEHTHSFLSTFSFALPKPNGSSTFGKIEVVVHFSVGDRLHQRSQEQTRGGRRQSEVETEGRRRPQQWLVASLTAKTLSQRAQENGENAEKQRRVGKQSV